MTPTDIITAAVHARAAAFRKMADDLASFAPTRADRMEEPGA